MVAKSPESVHIPHAMKEQKIVVVRHAHRHKPHPDEDNGLSDKGREQTLELVEAYKRGLLPPAKKFWSSPKLRCLETLKPLAEAAGADMTIDALLDERQDGESSKEFLERVEKLMRKAAALDETVYLCSHGDLIPEAVDFMTGRAVDVAKGQAIVIVNQKKKWELQP